MQSEPQMHYCSWFGLFLFRSPLLQKSIVFFLFLWVLRCFSSPRSPLICYFTHIWISRLFFLLEFPHSDIPGSLHICYSPRLFAACHVLLRLLVPRHSPYALRSLTSFVIICYALRRQASLLFRRHTLCIVSSQLIAFLVQLASYSKFLNLYASLYCVKLLRYFVDILCVQSPCNSSLSLYSLHLVSNS